MLKNIINSIWSTIVEPVEAFDIQVYDKEHNIHYNIAAFAHISYWDWKSFDSFQDYILDNLYEISNSEIYSAIYKNPYMTWIFINKLRSTICFLIFLEITAPPKGLHEKLFNLFYEHGIKMPLQNEIHYLGESSNAENEVSIIINSFMQCAVNAYQINIKNNKDTISYLTALLTKEMCGVFSMNRYAVDSNDHEYKVIEKVLIEYATMVKNDIYSRFIKANRINEIV